MNKDQILSLLHGYVADEILDGDAADLDSSTPLLELGVLNSLEVVRMTNFIERTLGFTMPLGAIRVENLATLSAITDTVFELQPK